MNMTMNEPVRQKTKRRKTTSSNRCRSFGLFEGSAADKKETPDRPGGLNVKEFLSASPDVYARINRQCAGE